MNLPPEAPGLPDRLLACASVLPDRDAILPLLPRGKVFAEVGVATGDFSQTVMAVCEPSLFIGIDKFRLHELTEFWGRPVAEVFRGRTHGEAYRARFAVAITAGRVRVLEGDSWDCLDGLPPGSVDTFMSMRSTITSRRGAIWRRRRAQLQPMGGSSSTTTSW